MQNGLFLGRVSLEIILEAVGSLLRFTFTQTEWKGRVKEKELKSELE